MELERETLNTKRTHRTRASLSRSLELSRMRIRPLKRLHGCPLNVFMNPFTFEIELSQLCQSIVQRGDLRLEKTIGARHASSSLQKLEHSFASSYRPCGKAHSPSLRARNWCFGIWFRYDNPSPFEGCGIKLLQAVSTWSNEISVVFRPRLTSFYRRCSRAVVLRLESTPLWLALNGAGQ